MISPLLKVFRPALTLHTSQKKHVFFCGALPSGELYEKSSFFLQKIVWIIISPKTRSFVQIRNIKIPPPSWHFENLKFLIPKRGNLGFSTVFAPLFQQNSLQNVFKHSGNYNFHFKSSKIQSLSQIQWATYPLYAFLVPTQSWDVNAGRNTFKDVLPIGVLSRIWADARHSTGLLYNGGGGGGRDLSDLRSWQARLSDLRT